MRFEVSPNLISTYYHEGWTQIDGLFTPDQLEKIEELMHKEGAIEARHDHFTKESTWKKLLFGSGPTHIASALSQKSALQIGFDQVFLPGELPELFALSSGDHLTDIEEQRALAISSFSSLACGMMICEGGIVTFFRPDALMDAPDGPCLICCWITPGSRYTENPDNPLGYLLKRAGYSSGDVIE